MHKLLSLAVLIIFCFGSLSAGQNRNYHFSQSQAFTLDAADDLHREAEQDKERFLKISQQHLTMQQKDEISKKAVEAVEFAKQAHHFASLAERRVEEIAQLGGLSAQGATPEEVQTLLADTPSDLTDSLRRAVDAAENAMSSAERAGGAVQEIPKFMPKELETATLAALSGDVVVMTIFEECGFKGRSRPVKANQLEGNFKGTMGSVRFELPVRKLTLFQNSNFQGAEKSFNGVDVPCVKDALRVPALSFKLQL